MLKKIVYLPALVLFLALSGCAGSSAPGMTGEGVNDALEENSGAQLKDGMICIPGTTQCVGSNFLTCNDEGSDWNVETCKDGTNCTTNGCVATECNPGQSRCDSDGKVQVCKPDGSGWGAAAACEKGKVCVGGQCLAKSCTPGDKKCIGNNLVQCNKQGDGWDSENCGKNKVCFQAKCVECFTDSNCPENMVCQDGVCMSAPPRITTKDLPPATINQPYNTQLEATGGTTPYTFTVSDGALPQGLQVDKDAIKGTPTVKGQFKIKIKLTDAKGLSDEKEFELIVGGPQLEIVSKDPLPDGEAEQPYDFQFKAAGGTKPYGWMISGKLPTGFVFTSEGHLQGTTEDPGDYSFKVKVDDQSNPIQRAEGNFTLHIKVAPLQIYGKQMLNLYMTRLIVLNLITIVQNIPVPYTEHLLAKGGIKPYHWTEVQVPGMLKTFLPHAGLPKGLTLADDGTISGSVTDTSQVMEVKIPFANITLKGFAFMAKVTDSQKTPDSDQALFFIPTVPVNLGGGGGGGLPLP